jgi:hypothetical protein
MWARSITALALSILLFGPCLVRRAASDEPKVDQPSTEEITQAQKQVEEELARLQGAAGRVQPITEGPLITTFPKYLFFSVVFRQFPVARRMPAPLQSGNVYAVPRNRGGQLQLFTDTKGLEAFFRSMLGRIQDDNTAKDVVRAWLQLAPIFSQDGFYQFVLQDDSTKVIAETPGRKVSGKVMVMAGGNGEIIATLTFDEAGKLVHVSQTASLKPGPRPICQATKLLDADPIVRRMAEQDLLVLGRGAQEYLAAQRAKASPELQQAIDRLWQRIAEEGR